MAFPPPQHFRGASYNREPPFEDGFAETPMPTPKDYYGKTTHEIIMQRDVWRPRMGRSSYPGGSDPFVNDFLENLRPYWAWDLAFMRKNASPRNKLPPCLNTDNWGLTYDDNRRREERRRSKGYRMDVYDVYDGRRLPPPPVHSRYDPEKKCWVQEAQNFLTDEESHVGGSISKTPMPWNRNEPRYMPEEPPIPEFYDPESQNLAYPSPRLPPPPTYRLRPDETIVVPADLDPKVTPRTNGNDHKVSGCLPGPSQPPREEGTLMVPSTSFPRTTSGTCGAQNRVMGETEEHAVRGSAYREEQHRMQQAGIAPIDALAIFRDRRATKSGDLMVIHPSQTIYDGTVVAPRISRGLNPCDAAYLPAPTTSNGFADSNPPLRFPGSKHPR